MALDRNIAIATILFYSSYGIGPGFGRRAIISSSGVSIWNPIIITSSMIRLYLPTHPGSETVKNWARRHSPELQTRKCPISNSRCCKPSFGNRTIKGVTGLWWWWNEEESRSQLNNGQAGDSSGEGGSSYRLKRGPKSYHMVGS